MINRVEFGNLNRGEDTPILIKEKISADGAPSVRIYQRKDVNSIENLTDRIKTTIKYGIEDFFIEHKKFQPLLEKIGFTKINQLKTDEIENPSNLLQAIKFGARIGLVAKKNKESLQSILAKNGFGGDYQFKFHKGSYKNEDFFIDLTEFVIQGNKFNETDTETLKAFIEDTEKCFSNNYILSDQQFKNFLDLVTLIEKKLAQHFSEQEQWVLMDSFEDKNLAATNSSKDGSSNLELLKSEIGSKLDEIKTRIKENSTNPNNEVIKSNLLFLLSELESKNGITTKEAAKTRGAIDIICSTGWWISDEKRQQSLEKVQNVFEAYKENLAEALRYAIYQSREQSNPLSQNDLDHPENPYVETGNDRQ